MLNGTATPGLAAQFAGQLKQRAYKVGPVGNTESPFTTSVVMFDPPTAGECAPIVGQIVGISKTQPMNNEVRRHRRGRSGRGRPRGRPGRGVVRGQRHDRLGNLSLHSSPGAP